MMMANNKSIRAMRDYQQYTGESLQYLSENLKLGNDYRSVADVTGAQQYLESRFLNAVGDQGEYLAHPFGFKAVRISPRGPLTLMLDPAPAGVEHAPITLGFLEKLLPFSHEGGVEGIALLRADVVDERRLELRCMGTNARLTLCSPGRTDWAAALAARRDQLTPEFVPLWDSPTATDSERTPNRHHLLRTESIAWIGSALLRRIALFHTSSTAHRSHMYCSVTKDGGFGWTVEMVVDQAAEMCHEQLIAALVRPGFGIPLVMTKMECWCTPNPEPEEARRACMFHFRHQDGRRGELRLRFCSEPTPSPAWQREHYHRAHANRRWINRVLPPATAPSTV